MDNTAHRSPVATSRGRRGGETSPPPVWGAFLPAAAATAPRSLGAGRTGSTHAPGIQRAAVRPVSCGALPAGDTHGKAKAENSRAS